MTSLCGRPCEKFLGELKGLHWASCKGPIILSRALEDETLWYDVIGDAGMTFARCGLGVLLSLLLLDVESLPGLSRMARLDCRDLS